MRAFILLALPLTLLTACGGNTTTADVRQRMQGYFESQNRPTGQVLPKNDCTGDRVDRRIATQNGINDDYMMTECPQEIPHVRTQRLEGR